MVVEAGTYGVIEVMDGIRMDRWMKFGKGRSFMPREEMRRSMMDKLFPEDPAWRDKALANGLEAQAQMFRSEEHTSELQSLIRITYSLFCFEKKKTNIN